MKHISVLKEELFDCLAIEPGMKVLDATYGYGGHASEASRLVGPEGEVFAFECDNKTYSEVEASVPANLTLINDNFRNLDEHFSGDFLFDAVYADLGINSNQLDDRKYGISFDSDAPVDMRFWSKAEGLRSKIGQIDEARLATILRDFADVPSARKLARVIIEGFRSGSVSSTGDLATLIRQNQPRNFKVDPATKAFMALRIWVNEEIESLMVFLSKVLAYMKPGAFLGVISFHSVEDRVVKNWVRDNEITGKDEVYGSPIFGPLKRVTRKPIVPSKEEVGYNPRSRSAKLRVIQKRSESDEAN